MPPRAPTPPPAWPHHALRGLVCLLLLGWAGKPASARIRTHVRPVPGDLSAPYLRVIGALPLRLQPAPVPSEPVARPAASGPPLPAAPVTSADPTIPAAPQSTPAVIPPAAETAPASTTPPPVAPSPIIPDELRPRVQAEDFLPYFQFPGSTGAAGEVKVLAPINITPATPDHGPPSSATYRQQ